MIAEEFGPEPSRYGVLVPAVMIAVACSTLVAFARVETASLVMWGLLGLMAAWFIFQERLDSLACLLIGVAPVVNLLRGAMFYTGVPLVLAGVVAWWMFTDPRKMNGVARRCPLAFVFLGMASVYYALSFATTGEFRSNLRVFELACAAGLVVMLGDQPRLLEQALLGLVISAVLVGLGDYPHLMSSRNMRLGMIQGQDFELGNPFALGVPLALALLAIALDRGRWLGLSRGSIWKPCLFMSTLILLGLSASRAGWAIAAAGLVVGLLAARQQRLTVVSWGVIAVIAGYLMWETSFASPVRKGWERTFGKELTLNRASGNRADQWVIFYHALTDNADTFLYGYGPGTGSTVQAEFSSHPLNITLGMGTALQFHGLLMHVGVEFGFIGLAPLTAWLFTVGMRCYQGCRASSLFLPFACFVGFFLASLTASAFDTVSGAMLGLGLLATFPSVNASMDVRHDRAPAQVMIPGNRDTEPLRME